MENGQIFIPELFRKYFFQIPLYQRSYSWGEDQLKDLFDDIKNQKANKDYFFGTLLLQEKSAIGEAALVDIVDGQQRVTSLSILISVILGKLKESGTPTKEQYERYIYSEGRHRLRLMNEDDEIFRNYVLGDEACSDSLLDTPSKKKLMAAKKYLTNRINNLTVEAKLEFLTKIEHTKVLVYNILDDTEAALIFETTNDRGLDITNLEKVKSFLMYKAYLCTNDPTNVMSDIQNRFAKIYREVDTLQKHGFYEEDSPLYFHYVAYEHWEKKEDYQYTAYLDTFKEHLTKLVNKPGNEQNALKYIQRFSKELQESYSNLREMYSPDRYPMIADIDILDRTYKFFPLLIKTYRFDTNPKKELFGKVARALEIFDFRVFGIMRRPINTAEANFNLIAREFLGDFDQLISDIKDLIKKYSPDKDLKTALMAGDFYYRIQNGDQKYLFWKYENHLRSEMQPVMPALGLTEFKNDDSKKSLTIEHIVPQSFEDGLKVIANKKILPDIDEDFEEKFLHCLGNLTIDPKSANSSKGKKDFATKDEDYFRQSTFKTQHELGDFLNSDSGYWDAESIERRRDKIVKFVQQHWSLNQI